MRIKIDENLPVECVQLFNKAGYTADTVYDKGLEGKLDSSIYDVCQKEGLVLLTLDLDFSDIRSYPPETHNGIIVFRLSSQSKYKIIGKIKQIIPIMEAEQLKGCLWIVDDEKIRIRGEQKD